MNRLRWYARRLKELIGEALRAARRDGIGGAARLVRATLDERRIRSRARKYGRWFKIRLRARQRSRRAVPAELLFSVVVPVFRSNRKHLRECIRSVRRQEYPRWELILVDDCSEDPALTRLLRRATKRDARIQLVELASNAGIGGATNAGIERARGEYVCFLDHDDELTPDALLLAADRLRSEPDIDFLYGDEDKISPSGRLVEPWFRPDRNHDLLLAYNFVSHPVAVRRSMLLEIGGLDADLGGSQDHDLALRLIDSGARFAHLAEVVYHWRISSKSTAGSASAKPYTANAGLRAVAASVSRQGLNASVRHGAVPNHYEVLFEVPGRVALGVVVCSTKPPGEVLDSLRYVIDPGPIGEAVDVTVAIVRPRLEARTSATASWPRTWRHVRGSIYEYLGWPNVAAALNYGAAQLTDADVFLFVADDVVALSPAVMKQLLGSVSRSDVGAVGAMEVGRDGKIVQSGIVLGADGPEYAFAGVDVQDITDHDLARCAREVTAVSRSFLMTKASAFSALGGFSERLGMAYFDLGYAVRLRAELGLRVVVDPTFPVLRGSLDAASDAGADSPAMDDAEPASDGASDYEKLALRDLLTRNSLVRDEFHAHNDVRLVPPPVTTR